MIFNNRHSIAIFGAAEKGKSRYLHFFSSLPEMADTLGNPPENSEGIHFAIQVLLFEQNLIFYKIKEEGFSKEDYFYGMRLLQTSNDIQSLTALCLPGVGDHEVIDSATKLCMAQNTVIITTQKDFYDYMTY